MTIIDEIMAELDRAKLKFPTWPSDPLYAFAVLGEECGELNKAVLQVIYEPHKSSVDDIRMEAIQTAAMAIRFLENLEYYEYSPCVHHDENNPCVSGNDEL